MTDIAYPKSTHIAPPRKEITSKRIVSPGRPETTVSGLHACLALCEKRKEDIVRMAILDERMKEFGGTLRWCAQNKRAYHIVTKEELDKIADTVHHEGVCILAKQKEVLEFGEFISQVKDGEEAQCVLLLENIGNPHNLGAIMRTCTHFGVNTILVPESEGAAALSPAVHRTAEGGSEWVQIVSLAKPMDALRALQKLGFEILATSDRGTTPLYDTPLAPRVVLMLGSEAKGLSSSLFRSADKIIKIPGTGNMASLNVATATSVFLGEFWRSHGKSSKKSVKKFAPAASTDEMKFVKKEKFFPRKEKNVKA